MALSELLSHVIGLKYQYVLPLYIQEIYKDNYYDVRFETRLEKSAPIIEEFIKYVDIEIENALPKSPLGQGLECSRKLLPSFRTFFKGWFIRN